MRKIKLSLSILFIFIATFLVSMNASAGAAFKYVWNNSTVVVPVGASLDEYKNKPVATLYRDGVVLSDAKITYNTEGDWLYYYKNVNTNVIGTYYVWYKAYESVYIPGTCTDYKCKVAFIVKDLEAPEITPITENVYVVKDSNYDLNQNVVAKDNYCESPIITFNHNIDFGKAGLYEVEAVARDESGNYSKTNFNVIIYDDAKYPVITCSQVGDDIIVPLGDSSFNIKQFFTATDYKDGDITSKIYYPSLDYNTLGISTYTVSVTNSAGLVTEYPVTIHVQDEEPPTMILSTHSIFLDYKTDFENYDYSIYIKSLTDNVEIDYDNLSINYNMENKIGSYVINYSYSDGVYVVSDSIDVSLVSYQSPKITVSDIRIKEDTNVDLTQYINIYDESDNNIYESLEIDDSKVNYSKEGTYYATAFAMNSSGMSSNVKFRVIITSDSLFSKANIGITITAIVLFVIVIALGTTIGIYLIRKKRKKI